MGQCLALCSRLLLRLRGVKQGAEYEKMTALMSPGPKAAAAASGGGGTQAQQDEDELDADFQDWEAGNGGASSQPSAGSHSSNSHYSSSQPASSSSRHGRSAAQPVQQEEAPPPPEPDFFGQLGMGIERVDQVKRVAAKRALPSSSLTPSAAASHNPSLNLYASQAAAAAASSTNAQHSRFLMDEDDSVAAPANGAAWGADDDLGSLGLEGTGSRSAGATRGGGGARKPKGGPGGAAGGGTALPREKKPRGIGAVAVALDGDA